MKDLTREYVKELGKTCDVEFNEMGGYTQVEPNTFNEKRCYQAYVIALMDLVEGNDSKKYLEAQVAYWYANYIQKDCRYGGNKSDFIDTLDKLVGVSDKLQASMID